MTSPSLLPREHGAYAQLAFPLLTGLLAGSPGLASWAFAIAAVAGFLLYEPVAVIVGTRGERLRTGAGTAVRARAWQLGLLFAVSGAAAVALAPPPARLGALVPLGCAVALAPSVLRGRQKALGAEIVVVTAFSTTVLPIGLAAGTSWRFAWTAAGVWWVSSTLGTMAVHAIKASHKAVFGGAWTIPATPILSGLVIAGTAAAVMTGRAHPLAALALVPTAAVTLALGLRPVHPRHLKRVGWTLVGVYVVVLVLLVTWGRG